MRSKSLDILDHFRHFRHFKLQAFLLTTKQGIANVSDNTYRTWFSKKKYTLIH